MNEIIAIQKNKIFGINVIQTKIFYLWEANVFIAKKHKPAITITKFLRNGTASIR